MFDQALQARRFGFGSGFHEFSIVKLVALTWIFVLAYSAQADVIPIDLNNFFFFAGDPVTVAADGSSATLGQLADVDPIQLANDPGLGDPQVIVATANTVLSFDYDFVETAGEDDEFGTFVLDPDTGDSIGAAFEFFTSQTSDGNVSMDLSPLDGVTGLGLLFQLASGVNDTGIGSNVTISNVRLEVIPEPTTAAMLGLMAVGVLRWRARHKQALS